MPTKRKAPKKVPNLVFPDTITLRVEVVHVQQESTAKQPKPAALLPKPIRDFCEQESEPFARDEMTRLAFELHETLKNWDAVMFELQRRYGDGILTESVWPNKSE